MLAFFKHAVIAFEPVAVIVMIIGAAFMLGRLVKGMLQGKKRHQVYRDFRHNFGRTLIIALDLLLAADIILTVTLDLSYKALGMLGLLVLIRTFLHFVLEVEVTGQWPWQGAV